MKRKRIPESGEVSQDPGKIKKQKPFPKLVASEGFLYEGNDEETEEIQEIQPKVSKKRGPKPKAPNGNVESKESFQPSASTSAGNGKKTKKTLADINQNGDASESGQSIVEPETLKKRKKNGLQSRSSSDSPSDFQPLGNFVKKSKEDLVEQEETASIPVTTKKKPGRKPASAVNQETIGQKEKNNKKNLDNQQGVLKATSKKKTHIMAAPDLDTAKKSKKKVRIDETESLKIKKELAEAESHFSAKELPAKIIKSKLNKNLTEEVKVSPVTVQSIKKDKKTIKKSGHSETGDEDDENTVHDKIESENGLDEKSYVASDESDLEVYYQNKSAEREARKNNPKKQSILMSKEDQLILVQRIQTVLPENDSRSYKYRIQNLEWANIVFKDYSIEDCQKVWAQLLKKVRHYRLLIEITHDVKHVIELNNVQVGNVSKSSNSKKKHPDMPKRPLSSYLLYYIRERDKVGKERPDLDTVELNKYISERYQNLPQEKKQKYELLAAKNKEKYKIELEEFYAKHPEMRKVVVKKETKRRKEQPPKRPDNPYRLFVQAELNREAIAEEDKAEFKEVCKEKWLQMPDSKKLGFINLAEELQTKYEQDLKDYMDRNPDYILKTKTCKPILTRGEINLKDKLAGKPKKPPGTAYGLFISMTLQSKEIVNIPPKERWNYTSVKWKAMKEEEREQYKVLLTQINEQYQKDFKTYLDSLPEEKRQAEILKNLPKKRKSVAKPSTSGKKIKTKSSKSGRKAKTTKLKISNPVPPPRSAYKYFAEKYEGENPKEAWKNIAPEEKERYNKELSVIKEKYIKDFETYLKSLTKDELAAFCANRNSQEGEYSSSDDTDSESDHDDEDSSGDESSENSDSDNDSDVN